jgi:hypothetical protein
MANILNVSYTVDFSSVITTELKIQQIMYICIQI